MLVACQRARWLLPRTSDITPLFSPLLFIVFADSYFDYASPAFVIEGVCQPRQLLRFSLLVTIVGFFDFGFHFAACHCRCHCCLLFLATDTPPDCFSDCRQPLFSLILATPGQPAF